MNYLLATVATILIPWLGCSRDQRSPATAAMSSAVPENAESNLAPADTAHIDRDIAGGTAGSCNEQSPQEFLQRAHLNHAAKSRAERAEMLKIRAAAIEYRTTRYGYFEGFGERKNNAKSPGRQSRPTTFFGLPIVMHEKVIPALKCVEQQLALECGGLGYKPNHLSGLRRKNTYVDGEVSNHVYGIAIDLDPLKNPCCKCLEPWSSSERCRGKKTVWERMAMPKCWVDVFERFGFYWLGHDVLEDTMHFEFLGDPDRIARSPDAKPQTEH